MQALSYPFDSEYILRKSKSIKRELLAADTNMLHKKIAVLGGSTTHDIIRILELFLLNEGIEPEFYESEYNNYWQDAMFDNRELEEFGPDLIFIHTTEKNITMYPQMQDSEEEVQSRENAQYEHFSAMWDKLHEKYHCPIVQNNFEYPSYRILGNRDNYDAHGHIAFINRLNIRFAQYAKEHDYLFINDINYVAACYGLDKWADSSYWHMYKYAMAMKAIPEFAFNVSHIIKAVFGKNKKAFVLDLDNTLWGGIVGDDGAENLEIGQETSMGQVYHEFQQYLKAHKDIGVLLNVDSKNEEENALAGLNHPAGVLKPDDFIVIKANWEPKSRNLEEIAETLNIGKDALVFVDDNPAEREIIRQQIKVAAVPEMTEAEVAQPDQFIRILDKNAYFEVVALSNDDAARNEMYKANAMRQSAQSSFSDYKDYLLSLEMKADIRPFEQVYYSRIAQLTNKSNQFNLTTRRMSQPQIEQIAQDDSYITLYGKLTDKFGDNGVVSLVIGQKDDLDNTRLNMILWLMSCRVLKRDMEQAMLDELVKTARASGIKTIYGYYYPTAKNAMVKNFYESMGFVKIEENEAGDTVWKLEVDNYSQLNFTIEINREN